MRRKRDVQRKNAVFHSLLLLFNNCAVEINIYYLEFLFSPL